MRTLLDAASRSSCVQRVPFPGKPYVALPTGTLLRRTRNASHTSGISMSSPSSHYNSPILRNCDRDPSSFQVLPMNRNHNTASTSTTVKLRNPPQSSSASRSRVPSIHWLFRSNIPRRRNSYLPADINKRNFFGMGEIIGVLTNPAQTVRSLTESKRLLEEARHEMSENQERSQLRPKHTFSRLPGFFPRKAEMQVIERALEGEPSFTVLFGASSTGKTALLREVLSREQYHVLHFDLRIAGFADLASLYLSLSQQMELYFEEIAHKMEGYEDFEKEAWSFKFDRQNVERRVAEASSDSKSRNVKTSDIARLMELFQSSLLKYWEFRPFEEEENSNKRPRRQKSDATSERTHVDPGANGTGSSKSKARKWIFGRGSKGKERESPKPARNSHGGENGSGSEKPREKPVKKMPVIFFDEAHKLPALIQSTDAMKCLLDSMLVLTKQDRLCHVIHATSDPFYQTWLRQLNVMQHCKIITIGDCSRSETKAFFRERMLPRVPERLRPGLRFEVLYDAFGGKLAHWQDYITDYINSNGKTDVKQCSHFLQAHALLNLHIIHSSQSPRAQEAADTAQAANTSNPETLHPGLGPAGFKIYSPITHPHGLGMGLGSDDDSGVGYYQAEFGAMQLLKVMSRLTQPDTEYLPYFLLCRELGVRAVDGMVKGRLLDLRWTETVTREGAEEVGRVRSGVVSGFDGMGGVAGAGSGEGEGTNFGGPGSSGTALEMVPQTSEEGMVPVSEAELGQRDLYEDTMEIIGPKLVPTTPIMRFAMRDVVQEYEDDRSVSEYASLSDVDEY
ncbi:hypothetical protein Hypma_009439 [Hypsizygus marmoreus]|uniref:AAA+ ATPase domain-containing protein n=1 Tax=Hypsizygus marmoreus TaxID=39966 RepID=A0A369JXF4_HYPMA|nr:hypothetical protein Hypma_009439 [Hypsizygus marmoreus]